MSVTWLRIGRVFCATCRKVSTVVRDDKVIEVRCPTCGSVVELEATGDELDE